MARSEIHIKLIDDSKVMDRLVELSNEIAELSDLIPDWNKLEKDKHLDEIIKLIKSLIKFK